MIGRIASILAGALVAGVSFAAPIAGDSLTFTGLQNGEPVLTYYDGGFGGFGSGPGPGFGVSFSNGLVADSTMIAFGPSALVQGPVTMDLDNAWSQGISFYYAGAGTISFYSGKDATGALLASLPLVVSPGSFNNVFGNTFGAFQSAVFSPAAGSSLRVDSISFGFAVIPEPSTAILFMAGLLVTVCVRFKSKAL
jgi:hypothetical protein